MQSFFMNVVDFSIYYDIINSVNIFYLYPFPHFSNVAVTKGHKFCAFSLLKI